MYKYQQEKRYIHNNEYVSYSHFIYHIQKQRQINTEFFKTN